MVGWHHRLNGHGFEQILGQNSFTTPLHGLYHLLFHCMATTLKQGAFVLVPLKAGPETRQLVWEMFAEAGVREQGELDGVQLVSPLLRLLFLKSPIAP